MTEKKGKGGRKNEKLLFKKVVSLSPKTGIVNSEAIRCIAYGLR